MADWNGLDEQVITAWVKLTGALKNTRIPKGMIYNEAIVMNLVYTQMLKDGEGLVSFKDLVAETKMLKSLVNRTIDSLVAKGYLQRCEGKDKRTTFVRPVKENLDDYLSVHENTLELVRGILEVIGEDDAKAFVRVSEKICAADPLKN